jgi:hypothetical protein
VVLAGQVVVLRSTCSDPIERGGVRVRRRGTRRARHRATSPAGGPSVRDSGTRGEPRDAVREPDAGETTLSVALLLVRSP